MRMRTAKVSLAVGKSVMSLARCSMVEMTAANADWLAKSFQHMRGNGKLEGRTALTLVYKDGCEIVI